jgi:hypothetical protein
MIKRWNSISEYIAEFKHRGVRVTNGGFHSDLGVNGDEALRRCQEGDPSIVGQVTKAVDKIQAQHFVEEPRMRNQTGVMGSRVLVPQYLSGSPFCMNKRTKKDVAVQHVTIYVAIAFCCDVTPEQMLKRGITILGLLEQLQARQISTDLYLMCDTNGMTDGDLHQLIRIESRPLDLSTSGFALSHPAFARCITYAMSAAIDGFSGQCPSSWGKMSWETYNKSFMPKLLGMGPNDIYIQEPRHGDLLIDDPERWLNERLIQLSGERP